MQSPNVPKTLAIARKLGWQFDIMSTSFFLSRRALKPAAHSGKPRWQDLLFIRLSRSANDADAPSVVWPSACAVGSGRPSPSMRASQQG
jgi:K+ transporter